jgi:hypothetical protein
MNFSLGLMNNTVYYIYYKTRDLPITVMPQELHLALRLPKACADLKRINLLMRLHQTKDRSIYHYIHRLAYRQLRDTIKLIYAVNCRSDGAYCKFIGKKRGIDENLNTKCPIWLFSAAR